MTRVRPHPWYDVAWPTVAGLAAGTSLLAAYLWSGPLVSLIALAVLTLTIAPLTWCVLTELGHDTRSAAPRIGLLTALTLFALVGLGQMMGSWALLVGAFVLVTSPLVRGWAGGGAVGSLVGHVSPRTETRRRFEEIVSHAFPRTPDDEWPHD